jgi:multidrug transporter EmrE-like cation transporter
MKLIFYFLILLLIIIEVSAQYLFKLSYLKKSNLTNKYNNVNTNVNTNVNYYFIIGFILYSISGFFVYKVLEYGDLGVINVIWHLLHFFSLFFVSYYFLGEKLTNKKIIGSIFGIISLFLLMGESHHH